MPSINVTSGALFYRIDPGALLLFRVGVLLSIYILRRGSGDLRALWAVVLYRFVSVESGVILLFGAFSGALFPPQSVLLSSTGAESSYLIGCVLLLL